MTRAQASPQLDEALRKRLLRFDDRVTTKACLTIEESATCF
jgi:hypothetical protein